MKNYGCKLGWPHDILLTADTPTSQDEQCKTCGERFTWNKDHKGRVDSKRYLEVHVRDFCQATGPHAQLYYLLYHPELYEKNKWKWTLFICVNDDCAKDNWKYCHHGREEKHTLRDLTKPGTNANN